MEQGKHSMGSGGQGDDLVGQPFDQTNDQVDGLEGESNGLAGGDEQSEAYREEDAQGLVFGDGDREDDDAGR